MPTQVLAQPKVVKETVDVWNGDRGTWDSTSVSRWKYDAEGRNILHLTEGGFSPDLPPYYLNLNEKEFDEYGNLVTSYFHYRGDFGEGISQNEYTYALPNELLEIKYLSKIGESDTFTLRGFNTYAYDMNGQRKSEKRYTANGILRHHTDTLFDTKGCVEEILIRSYNAFSQVISITDKIIFTRDEECRVLTMERYSKKIPCSFFSY